VFAGVLVLLYGWIGGGSVWLFEGRGGGFFFRFPVFSVVGCYVVGMGCA